MEDIYYYLRPFVFIRGKSLLFKGVPYVPFLGSWIIGNFAQDYIAAAFEAYRILGYGFLEKVYQKAMQVEMPQNGLQAELEQPIKIQFREPSLAITTLIRSSRGK